MKRAVICATLFLFGTSTHAIAARKLSAIDVLCTSGSCLLCWRSLHARRSFQLLGAKLRGWRQNHTVVSVLRARQLRPHL